VLKIIKIRGGDGGEMGGRWGEMVDEIIIC